MNSIVSGPVNSQDSAKARGVVGAVIDGFVTDRSAIEHEDFPVWCRGRSPITTKPRRLGGDFNVTVGCGGVSVRPGDMILADENGVVVLDKKQAANHAARARKMQEDEVGILERLRAGETLADITRGAKQPS